MSRQAKKRRLGEVGLIDGTACHVETTVPVTPHVRPDRRGTEPSHRMLRLLEGEYENYQHTHVSQILDAMRLMRALKARGCNSCSSQNLELGVSWARVVINTLLSWRLYM